MALIQHTEVGERGPMLRLALPGGLSETAGRITVYESQKILQCAWGCDVLRWELQARDGMTLLVFTHEHDASHWESRHARQHGEVAVRAALHVLGVAVALPAIQEIVHSLGRPPARVRPLVADPAEREIHGIGSKT